MLISSPNMYLLSLNTRQRNLTNIITFNTMQFTLNYFHVLSHYFCIKQNTKNSLSLMVLTTFLLIPFAFLFTLPFTLNKE